jgi:hypothetical protein
MTLPPIAAAVHCLADHWTILATTLVARLFPLGRFLISIFFIEICCRDRIARTYFGVYGRCRRTYRTPMSAMRGSAHAIPAKDRRSEVTFSVVPPYRFPCQDTYRRLHIDLQRVHSAICR